MKYLPHILVLLFCQACSQGEITTEDDSKNTLSDESVIQDVKNEAEEKLPSTSDSTYTNLIDIQSINPDIHIDLKYASTDNFMKQQLYFNLTKVYLQKEVAERLSKCQQYLKTLYPTYNLLVYDGVRPVSVQQRMWNALDTIPVAERGKFVSNPKNHSVHNYGAAVDLTIIDENNQPLDMGAGYDDIRKIAYPSMEAHFLNTGELTQNQVNNRKLLRKVMSNQGFINIPSEWWHFNAYSRDEVKRRYKVVMEEPR